MTQLCDPMEKINESFEESAYSSDPEVVIKRLRAENAKLKAENQDLIDSLANKVWEHANGSAQTQS
jgi:hypothetical protein